ncbi:hypothetical protein O2K51_13630 [Apibacter raozihei]|uniref:hypothetical protein n=1 Tax=Apibacter raozihei TaxID=2500547 RepID=UPI000FE340BD|nr:hypothetical protein [Apibacter raozihei]
MKIIIYNAQTGLKKEWEEENSWENAKQIYDEIPDISGCFLLINKNQLGIKFQVINKDFFKSILIYRDEQKPVIINKEEGQKVLKLLLDDELEYVRLFDFPEKYFNNSSAKSQANVSIAKADISPNSGSETLVFKTHKGKNYTKEEWGKFEQEQFKLYAQKNKIPLEEEKPKKGGKFFLDEKESDF